MIGTVLVIMFAVLVALIVVSRWCWPLPPQIGTRKTSAPLVKGETTVLTVGTFNIHRARGLDGRKDLPRVAQVVSACDVTGLQEVEGVTLFHRQSQAERLAKQLQCEVHFSPTRLRAFFPERGNALLSQWSITAWRRQPLVRERLRGKGYRNFTEYTVQVGGHPVVVINTHLSKPEGKNTSLEKIVAVFMRHERAVLIGDFNRPPGHESFACLYDAGAIDALSSEDSQRVDHIFVRGFQVLSSWALPPGPSDHPFFAVRLSL